MLLQRKVVGAFCQNRPNSEDPKIHRLPIWRLAGEPVDECGAYVNDQMRHHITTGLALESRAHDEVPEYAHSWICHWPGAEFRYDGIYDTIAQTTWTVLGSTRLETLFWKAVAAEDWWLAYCTGGLAGYLFVKCALENGFGMMARGEFNEIIVASSKAAVKAMETRPPQLTTAQHESWELRTRMNLSAWLSKGTIPKPVATAMLSTLGDSFVDENKQQIIHLLENTDAGRLDPMDVATLSGAAELTSAYIAGDFFKHDQLYIEFFQAAATSALQRGQAGAQECIASFNFNAPVLRMPEWKWDQLDRALEIYDYDPDLGTAALASSDKPSPMMSLWPAVRAGDIAKSNQCFDTLIKVTKDIAAGESSIAGMPAAEMAQLMTSLSQMDTASGAIHALHLLGRDQDATDLMNSLQTTWATADAVIDELVQSPAAAMVTALGLGIRPRGSMARLPGIPSSAEDYSWTIRLSYVLVTTRRDVSAAEVVAALPSPDVLDSYVGDISEISGEQRRTRDGMHSLTLLAALVCEKLDKLDDALLYVDQALRRTPRQTFVEARAAVVADATTAATEIIATMQHVKSFPEPVQEAIKGALQLGEPGIRQLITMTVNNPQTASTAGKSDGFKADVAAQLLVGDFEEVLKAQYPEVQIAEGGNEAQAAAAAAAAAVGAGSEEEIDPTIDTRPTTITQGQALRGRVLAAQGKKAEAEAAFEEAVKTAHTCGLRLFEMFALRDLKKHILDGDGRGEEGLRRLRVVLQEMKGPAAELTKLLGDELDAEAILRS